MTFSLWLIDNLFSLIRRIIDYRLALAKTLFHGFPVLQLHGLLAAADVIVEYWRYGSSISWLSIMEHIECVLDHQ